MSHPNVRPPLSEISDSDYKSQSGLLKHWVSVGWQRHKDFATNEVKVTDFTFMNNQYPNCSIFIKSYLLIKVEFRELS